jgi:hypothetical protein
MTHQGANFWEIPQPPQRSSSRPCLQLQRARSKQVSRPQLMTELDTLQPSIGGFGESSAPASAVCRGANQAALAYLHVFGLLRRRSVSRAHESCQGFLAEWLQVLSFACCPADPFAEAVEKEDSGAGKDYVHIRIQQRNGKKSLTTIQVTSRTSTTISLPQ